MSRGRANGRHVGHLTEDEAEARTSALEKLNKRTGPRAVAAIVHMGTQVDHPLMAWQVDYIRHLYPPLTTVAHVLQSAAAGNA